MYVAVGDPPFLRRRGYINTRLCCVVARVCVRMNSGLLCSVVSWYLVVLLRSLQLFVCVDAVLNQAFFILTLYTYFSDLASFVLFPSPLLLSSSPPLSPEEV